MTHASRSFTCTLSLCDPHRTGRWHVWGIPPYKVCPGVWLVSSSHTKLQNLKPVHTGVAESSPSHFLQFFLFFFPVRRTGLRTNDAHIEFCVVLTEPGHGHTQNLGDKMIRSSFKNLCTCHLQIAGFTTLFLPPRLMNLNRLLRLHNAVSLQAGFLHSYPSAASPAAVNPLQCFPPVLPSVALQSTFGSCICLLRSRSLHEYERAMHTTVFETSRLKTKERSIFPSESSKLQCSCMHLFLCNPVRIAARAPLLRAQRKRKFPLGKRWPTTSDNVQRTDPLNWTDVFQMPSVGLIILWPLISYSPLVIMTNLSPYPHKSS